MAEDIVPRGRVRRQIGDQSGEAIELRLLPQRGMVQAFLLRGGCTLEAAEAVCRGPGSQEYPLLEILEALVTKSLLLQGEQPDGEPRFTMLETIREFALDQLQHREETEAVQRRHLTHFLSWAVDACRRVHGADQLEWIARLDRDEDNLRAALAWCVQRGQNGDCQATEQGLQLAGALGHWYWWTHHTRYTEGLAWLERLLNLPEATARTAGRARALLGAGLLSLPSGWFPQGGATPAWARYEEALAIGRAVDDKGICAMACMGLGYMLPDPAARLASREQGLRLYREVNDAWGIAFALWSLGDVYAHSGDLATAKALYKQSVAANAAVGDRNNSAGATMGLARVAAARGDVTTAQALLEQALRLDLELDDRRSSCMTLAHLGDLALHSGDGAAARRFYGQALPTFLDSGDSGMSALVLTGLAAVALKAAAPARAVRLAGAAARVTDGPAWLPGERWVDVPDPLQIRAAAAQMLNEKAIAEAWAEGQAMTLEQAIAEALEETGPGAHT